MLSIVATWRSLESLSGAIRPMARQAPLNSSISAISERTSDVMLIESASRGTTISPSISTRLFTTDRRQLSIHFHPIGIWKPRRS
ncbi:MAG TPA: hypothetical protein VGF71_04985 [Caulobacteraceae bacterium]